jgi:DNA modification methylase
MVFTDPPYGIGIDGQKESKCANPKHNRKAHEFRGWDNTRPDKSVFDYILSLNIPSVIFGGNYFADMLPATRGWIYWSKGQDGLTMSDGELAWTNVDKLLICVTVNRANLGKTVHPTQKPLKVVEFCLDYAGDGEVVLDLFGGSGSTLIACEQLNRKCYMAELDPKYVSVIVQRWLNLTGRKDEIFCIRDGQKLTYDEVFGE